MSTWLAIQDAYILHKAVRKYLNRNKVIVEDVDVQCQADLADVQQHSKYNDSVKYILKVIAILCKHYWAIGLKGTPSSETTCAFKTTFSRGSKSWILQTDCTL